MTAAKQAGGDHPADPAAYAWALMQQFVSDQNRHEELRETLGFGLGAGRGKVLFQLRQDSLTLTQIADANGFDAPYATLVVDKLQAHGLVERRPHPEDGRRKLVALTDAGHAAVATADAILLRTPHALADLGDDVARRLADLLQRLQ
ncbi:MarR family winged helix-turn-helix transcriptional regulator [Allobranchiibius sp. GilTou73]|uniref:MarR family winged helix-turn-helix transcriptional regulator n=1 Tax=Allobranchiibius sp. GilTou73 TaxID=2904523 RepID=UPI001F2843D6|nr:MarR family transcriptional regulator [Allobranchiibius sp. GilTou73]UIJ35477.1 MarR family transcriptional regulator [Allobranchiibius sp. GilTou73]